MDLWKWVVGFFAFVAIAHHFSAVYATDEVVKELPVPPAPPTPIVCEPVPEPTPDVPEPEPVCVEIDYDTLRYDDTTRENVQEFLLAVPECNWCSACGTYSRYTMLEAKKKNLSVGEITLIDPDADRVKRMMLDGHRMNYFDVGDIRYYIDNTLMHRTVLSRDEIPAFIEETYGITITRTGFKDVKEP